MSAAERKAAHRERAREAGLCDICCRRKARKGKASCKHCYEVQKAGLYRRRAAAKAAKPQAKRTPKP
jgi:hypothetical protein